MKGRGDAQTIDMMVCVCGGGGVTLDLNLREQCLLSSVLPLSYTHASHFKAPF